MPSNAKNNLHWAGLLLGSNQGDKKLNLKRAVEMLERFAGNVSKISAIYETAPWGITDQPDFYNRALLMETYLSPEKLIKAILEIEKQLGRVRDEKWGPRIIDIDILFYDNEIIDQKDLKIPHPQLHKRKFALIPLAEIDPDWLHPQLEKDIKSLIEECIDELPVKMLK